MQARIEGQTKYWTGFQAQSGADIKFDILLRKQFSPKSELFQAKILKDQDGGLILTEEQAKTLTIEIPQDLIQKHAKDDSFELTYSTKRDIILNKIFMDLPVFDSKLNLYNHECWDFPVTITKKSASSSKEVILGKDFLDKLDRGYGRKGRHGIVDNSFPNHNDTQLLIFTAIYLTAWVDKTPLLFYEQLKEKLKTVADKDPQIEHKNKAALWPDQKTNVIEFIPAIEKPVKQELLTSGSTKLLSSNCNLLEESLTKSMQSRKTTGRQLYALDSLVRSKRTKLEDLNGLSNFNITNIKIIPTNLKTKWLITVSMKITQLKLKILPLVVKATLATTNEKAVADSCSVISFDETKTGDFVHEWSFTTDSSFESLVLILQLYMLNNDELEHFSDLGTTQINLRNSFY